MKKLQASLLCLLCLLIALPALAQDDFAVRHGDETQPRIALTMDDCYSAENVQKTLALCNQFQVPITFFILGDALKDEDAAVWQAVAASPCEIGNHTFGHPDLGNLTVRQIDSQLRRTQERLDAVLGYHYPMQVMRPPFGHLDNPNVSRARVHDAIRHAGIQRAVLWNVSQTDPDKAYTQARNGCIMLFHANGQDLRCLSALIPRLLADGYELCTVSDLLALPPVATATDLYVYDPKAAW